MFHVTKEGESLHRGFNFYPWSDDASLGFRLKAFGRVFMVRRSSKLNRWILKRI